MEKEGKFDKIGIWILKKIEQAYTYLLENVQVIQSDLATNFMTPWWSKTASIWMVKLS